MRGSRNPRNGLGPKRALSSRSMEQAGANGPGIVAVVEDDVVLVVEDVVVVALSATTPQVTPPM